MGKTFRKETDLETGVVVEERYTWDWETHRDSKEGPALIERDPETGHITCEMYYEYNQRHRDGGPAFISYSYTDGSVMRQQWYRRGHLHRADGPACIGVNEQDEHEEKYYRYGKLYRDSAEGPCWVCKDKQGNITYEKFSEPTPRASRPSAPRTPLSKDSKHPSHG